MLQNLEKYFIQLKISGSFWLAELTSCNILGLFIIYNNCRNFRQCVEFGNWYVVLVVCKSFSNRQVSCAITNTTQTRITTKNTNLHLWFPAFNLNIWLVLQAQCMAVCQAAFICLLPYQKEVNKALLVMKMPYYVPYYMPY